MQRPRNVQPHRPASDGYPHKLPQPAGALTYKLNGALVGRGNILNIVGEGIASGPLDDGITYYINTGISSVVTDSTLGGDGTTTDPLHIAQINVDGITIIGNGYDTPLTAVTNPTGKSIISGGITWSGTGYVFDVSAIAYTFDGVFYTTSPTQVTMATSDPTNNRFDAVVVDVAGAVTVITGTAGANPVFPTIPEDKIAVGYVSVEASTTSPTILTDTIYLENTEWTTSTYTTGGGSIGTIDFNSTDAPKQGIKCAKATGTNLRLGMRFSRSTAINLQTFAYVQVWARLTAVVPTTKSLTVRLENSLGNPLGSTVNLFNYGMSRTVVGTWQLVVIPVSAFGAITNIKGLRAIMTGGSLSSVATWSLDFMLLSGGLLPQGELGPVYLSPSGTLYSTGAGIGATSVANSIFFGTNAGFQAISATGAVFMGYGAGYRATNAVNSNFFGAGAGYRATLAYGSNFFGVSAGIDAGFANTSNFFGNNAGAQATFAYGSTFIGSVAGAQATFANNSIFIGNGAGNNDTVDNSASGTSILIGDFTNTGGFSNSIGLGQGATNTATNQFMIGSTATPINQVIISGTGGIKVPVGTTTDRISTQGMIRYNTTTSKFEGYNGTLWVDLN